MKERVSSVVSTVFLTCNSKQVFCILKSCSEIITKSLIWLPCHCERVFRKTNEMKSIQIDATTITYVIYDNDEYDEYHNNDSNDNDDEGSNIFL